MKRGKRDQEQVSLPFSGRNEVESTRRLGRRGRVGWLCSSFVLLACCSYLMMNWNYPGGNGENGVSDARSTDQNTEKRNAEEPIPILPLPKAVQYSHRPTGHLTTLEKLLTLPAHKDVHMVYFEGSDDTLKKDSLYGFNTYTRDFEGSVTYTWVSILAAIGAQEEETSLSNSSMVVDGGMNTGFYTLLSATLGFPVYSFELQLDCFDVVNKLLLANTASVQKSAHLYYYGLSNKPGVMQAGEGCDPSYNLMVKESLVSKNKGGWERRSHQVALISLDKFLDQTRQSRRIPILKLDVEGAEIQVLQGLQKHLPYVDNIIMECAIGFMKRFNPLEDALVEFERLRNNGFESYLLYTWALEQDKWANATFLQSAGLQYVEKHPISGLEDYDTQTVLWKIMDWESMMKVACPVGCNLLFHRRKA